MTHASHPIRAAVLTVSDRCSRGLTEDLSGPALQSLLKDQLGAEIVSVDCVADEIDAICDVLTQWSRRDSHLDLIITTGGTGLAPRDVTPEAAKRVIQREHMGLMELARSRCSAITPRAYLSRGIAGATNGTLIITLPGSPRGATENLHAIIDILPHAIETLRGEVQDDGRPDAAESTGRVIVHKD